MANDDLFILGGARTPMTQHVGALKDVSAIELGAVATRGALAADRRRARTPSTTSSSATCSRAAPTRTTARGTSGLRAGLPIEVPALTVNRLCGSGIQAVVSGAQQILLGEAGVVRGRRHGEHEPGAARDSRPAQRPAPGPGQARGLAVGRAERPLRRLLDGDHRRELRGEVRHHARGVRPLRAAQPAAARTPPGRRGVLAEEVVPVEVQGAQGRDDRSIATITCGPRRRSRGWPRCRPCSRRTASSPPATPAASSTARRRWSSPRATRREAHGLTPLGPHRVVGGGRRRADPDGHGPGAGHPQGARARRPVARTSSTSSRSTRRSRRSTWRARRSSGLDRDRINVNGGAIALGHPLGRQRRPAAADAGARAAPAQEALRRRLGLHRRRAGDCHDDRGDLEDWRLGGRDGRCRQLADEPERWTIEDGRCVGVWVDGRGDRAGRRRPPGSRRSCSR